MGDSNLRVWPADGDTHGEVTEYPRYAKYRYEPHFPGATGPANTDLVVYERGEDGSEDKELARHKLSDVLMALPGQPTPAAVLESEQDRRVTHTSKPTKATGNKAGSPVTK